MPEHVESEFCSAPPASFGLREFHGCSPVPLTPKGVFNPHIPDPEGLRVFSVYGPDPEHADGRAVVIDDLEEELACGWCSVGIQRLRLFEGNSSGDLWPLP
jgi:hypothetical protein